MSTIYSLYTGGWVFGCQLLKLQALDKDCERQFEMLHQETALTARTTNNWRRRISMQYLDCPQTRVCSPVYIKSVTLLKNSQMIERSPLVVLMIFIADNNK